VKPARALLVFVLAVLFVTFGASWCVHVGGQRAFDPAMMPPPLRDR